MRLKSMKVMTWIFLPLLFLLVGYLILGLLAKPYIRPLTSIYEMISQNQTPDFSSKTRDLYTLDNKIPTSGTVDGTTIGPLKVLDKYGEVEIAAVDIKVPLIYGSTPQCLRIGVGQRVQSQKPGYEKPVMIAGHTIPYFKNLGKIKQGDSIKISTFYGIFEYQVTSSKVANASDTTAYDLTQNKEQLILFTCYPLDGIGEKEDRLFVYADKISGPTVVGEANE